MQHVYITQIQFLDNTAGQTQKYSQDDKAGL